MDAQHILKTKGFPKRTMHSAWFSYFKKTHSNKTKDTNEMLPKLALKYTSI